MWASQSPSLGSRGPTGATAPRHSRHSVPLPWTRNLESGSRRLNISTGRNFCLRLRVERRGTGRCGLKDVASYPCALTKRAKEHLIISQNWMATTDDIGRRQVLSVSHTISSSSLISREPRCLAAPLMHIHFVMQSRAGSGLLMPKRSSCQRGPRGQRCRIGFCRRIPQNCHMRRMSS